ncbi:unnamed protein product [Penicillium bialowiezense]
MSTNFTNDDEFNQMLSYDGDPSSYPSQPMHPGSFPSSEEYCTSGFDGYDGYDHINFPGSIPSRDDTSQTSFSQSQGDSLLHQSGWSEATACPTVPPRRFESDLDAFGGGFEQMEEDHPDDLEGVLGVLGGENIPTQNPPEVPDAQTVIVPSATLDRTMLGLTNRTAVSLHSLSVEQTVALNHLLTIIHHVGSKPPPYGNEEISQGQKSMKVLDQLLTSKPAECASTTTGSESRNRPREAQPFECIICEVQGKVKQPFPTFGSFKRHLGSFHDIMEEIYHCPHPFCAKQLFRRDRAREHLMLKHKLSGEKADLDAIRKKYAPPCTCPVCPQNIQSWGDFWDHFKDHCIKPSPPVSALSGGDRPHRGGNGGGKKGGDGGGNGPSRGLFSFAEPSNAHHTQSYQGNQPPEKDHRYSTYQGGYMDKAKEAARPSMGHPVSDDGLSLVQAQGLDASVDEFSMEDMFNPPFDPNVHFAGGMQQQPNQFQTPQTPWIPPTDQSSKRPQKRKRSARKEAPPRPVAEQKPPSSRRCTRCGHDLSTCRHCQYLTESVGSCHNCPDRSAATVQAGPPSELPAQTRQIPLPTVYTLDEQYLQPVYSEGSALFPGGIGQQPHPNSNHMQYPGGSNYPRSFDNAEYDGTDDFTSRSPFIGVAMVDENHGSLLGVNRRLQSPVFDRDFKMLRKVGVSSPVESISLLSQFNQAIKQASSTPSPGIFTEVPLRNREPLTLKIPQPAFECQCPCAILPAVDKYSARASAKLSSSERVEMTFKMVPASRESNHPLRTRIRVFVKLFKLRSSVSKPSGRDRRRKQSIQSEAAAEDNVGSDTDSDQALSPISPSGSELAPVTPLIEDVQDWSFEFDLEWAISIFSQITSDITVDTYLKLFPPHPGRILDFISMFFMREFEKCWTLDLDRAYLFLIYLMMSCSSSNFCDFDISDRANT